MPNHATPASGTLMRRCVQVTAISSTMPQGTRVSVLYKGSWYPGSFHKYDRHLQQFYIQCDAGQLHALIGLFWPTLQATVAHALSCCYGQHRNRPARDPH